MDREFQKKLLATFRVETRERLDAVTAGLIELEKAPGGERQQEIVEAVFRETHSLKGAARAVGMAFIETLSHGLESVFAAMKRQELAPYPELCDLLHGAVDMAGLLLPTLETGPGPGEREQLRQILLRLQQAAQGQVPSPRREPQPQGEAGEPPARPHPPQTVRIATGKLDALLQQTEGMLAAKLAAGQRGAELRELGRGFVHWEKEWKKVLPTLRKLRRDRGATGDREAVLLDFLDWQHTHLKAVAHRLTLLTKAAENDHQHLGTMVEAVLDDVRQALLLPFSALLAALPKTVRDLARDRGKEVALAVEGEAIEIDRRLLEEMKDPLVHLVRNCVDHGIERPGERERQGKPRRGTISVAVAHLPGNRVEIAIADDGAGIDPEQLRQAAMRSGHVTAAEAERLSGEELLSLVYTSGFSTSPIIDDISGRGLGLAIVREKVENLGGAIALATSPGEGTTFRITLPLTLSTFRGVLVEAAGQLFVLPTSDVERVTRLEKSAIATVENRETVELEGRPLSFVLLGDALGLPRRSGEEGAGERITLVVLATGQGEIAFGVDRVHGEQEVVVKGFGKQLRRVRNFAGATVLGSGRVVPILNSRDLAKSAVKAVVGAAPAVVAAEEALKTVLIAEDSITARTLLKNILEGAGYRALTAVDGIDALTVLKSEEVDLVVSDVDMPRLNGFELTGRIRASREFADLPVVLVTSLDSRQDRERGIDAGANAYIVKSSFDQSNLLTVIRRLL